MSNARVQLRAVGPTGVEPVAISISEQALNHNDFLRSRARPLQRMLASGQEALPERWRDHDRSESRSRIEIVVT
jgi:hypothetical protein